MIIESNISFPFDLSDQYPIGDLSGKLQMRNKDYPHDYLLPITPGNELNGIYWDVFLPMKGVNSIVHRALTVDRYNRKDEKNSTRSIWACNTITLYQDNRRYQTPMITAQVLFRYPIVGRILFRQPRDDPLLDTTVIVEYLIHADGSTLNNSESHRWAIHHDAPGKDFYNWTGRCLSTNHVYNPFKVRKYFNYFKISSRLNLNLFIFFKVSFNMQQPQQSCSPEYGANCRLGDLTNRIGTISIAGSKKYKSITRSIYTDAYLPLSGHNNIFGKSMVIYDDFGPKARGERLACSM